ncbi:hypothetical protein I4100191B2_02260 [Clostridiales bacterium]
MWEQFTNYSPNTGVSRYNKGIPYTNYIEKRGYGYAKEGFDRGG